MAAVTGDDGTPSGFTPSVPFGVWGDSGSQGPFSGGNGVIASSRLSSGVAGFTLEDSNRAAGVFGAGPRVGVAGAVAGSNTAPGDRVGVYGTGANGLDLGGVGVHGESDTDVGVIGESTSGSGVLGRNSTGSGAGVVGVSGQNIGLLGISSGAGVVGLGGINAGLFFGDVQVTGTITKGGGGFTIDHPLDPANRYLRHSFVESSEMKNLYDGIVICDADGTATVTVPEWFESLNTGFRYQLTPIGGPGPNLHIATELRDHQFKLAGGTPRLKVSWQVTGVRQDAWAAANPMVVEDDKSAAARGRYLHPEAHGQPRDRSTAAAYHAEAAQHMARVQPPSEPGTT
jgi:hypothetical protein